MNYEFEIAAQNYSKERNLYFPIPQKELMNNYGKTLSNSVCITDFHEMCFIDRDVSGKMELVNSRIVSFLAEEGLCKKYDRAGRQEIEQMVGRVENQLLMRSLPLRKKLKFLSRVFGVSK